MLSQFTAHSRIFESSKRCVCLLCHPAVNENKSISESIRYLNRIFKVFSHHTGDQPILRIISSLNNFFNSLELNDAHHWPEYLLLCDSHVISHISKHSGLQEVPRSIDTVASTEKLCSLFLSNVNIVENLFGLLL